MSKTSWWENQSMLSVGKLRVAPTVVLKMKLQVSQVREDKKEAEFKELEPLP